MATQKEWKDLLVLRDGARPDAKGVGRSEVIRVFLDSESLLRVEFVDYDRVVEIGVYDGQIEITVDEKQIRRGFTHAWQLQYLAVNLQLPTWERQGL